MRLLLVEPDEDIAGTIKSELSKLDFVVDQVASLAHAEEAIETTRHDGMICERKLHDGDALSLVRALRRRQNPLPIILLSVLGEAHHRIEGLSGGADDYLPKPFLVAELVARLRAILRRPPTLAAETVLCGKMLFEWETGTAFVGEEDLFITRSEGLVLRALLRRQGHAVHRETLFEALYGFEDTVESNSLDAIISRLRRKLRSFGAQVQIASMRGVGYLIRPASEV